MNHPKLLLYTNNKSLNLLDSRVCIIINDEILFIVGKKKNCKLNDY